jgi:asparagine synthase (glutamine-hydrolysing)
VLNNFRNLNSLYQSLGARWLMFRVGYALRKRVGLMRRQFPAYDWKDRPLETWLKKSVPSTPEQYAKWRSQNSPKFFFEPRYAQTAGRVAEGVLRPWNPELAVDEAERILNGEIKYFAHKFVQTGFPPDWHKDPVSGIKLDPGKHWSEISDDQEVDIKFIWEASRFSMVYPLVRAYASTRDEKYAEAFWGLLQSWADSNPPNMGPNWMDGQEAALRLMAWTFGFYAFMDCPSTTSERIAQLTVMVAAHAERISKNIDYAISTRSNHTISEAFGLWLTGLLFPELKDAEKYIALARKRLEQEASAQIFPDGSYSMYSLNYHRFILHVYFWMIRLGELNHSPISDLIIQRISASIDFLYQWIDPETGQMPLYGSNDSALLLPLNNCDFTDYRPLLQLGSYLTKKKFLFEPGPWDEDVFWFCDWDFPAKSAKDSKRNLSLSNLGVLRGESFPDGGVYLLRSTNGKAIIYCRDFRSRPSHADQLHVDLWLVGQNIACDAGTYLYSGKGVWRNGLAKTSVHNTVTVDHQDQMKIVSRFTWTDWSKGKVLRHDEKTWQGEHNGYKRLVDPIHHKRTVSSLGEDRWLIVDYLTGKRNHRYALHWLLGNLPFEQGDDFIVLSLDSLKYKMQVGLMNGRSTFSVVRADPDTTRGWRSRYYGDKEPAISALLETNQPSVCFWTFFGFEADKVELEGTYLQIEFDGLQTSIPLQSQISNY